MFAFKQFYKAGYEQWSHINRCAWFDWQMTRVGTVDPMVTWPVFVGQGSQLQWLSYKWASLGSDKLIYSMKGQRWGTPALGTNSRTDINLDAERQHKGKTVHPPHSGPAVRSTKAEPAPQFSMLQVSQLLKTVQHRGASPFPTSNREWTSLSPGHKRH